MIAALTLGSELDPNAVLATIGSIIVAGIAALAGRAGIARAKAKRAAGAAAEEDPTVSPSPLAAFAGTQNEFMALVVQDSVNLRAEIVRLDEQRRAELEAHRTSSAAELDVVRQELAVVRADLEAARTEHTNFSRAVRRYLEQLAHAWPLGGDPMPFPETSDAPLLERVLPHRRRRQA